MTDRPVGKEPEQVTVWLENQIEDKRHKRRAREVQRVFMQWAVPRREGFVKASGYVCQGKHTTEEFENDKLKAIAYVQQNYCAGPIVTILFWAVLKAIIERLVRQLFDLCLKEPDFIVYLGEPPNGNNGSGRTKGSRRNGSK